MFKPALVLLFCMGLLGCQSNQTPFVPQAIKKPGNGKIYVYWAGQRWAEKSGKSAELQIDGVPVGVLRYKKYIEMEMAAGSYELRLTGDSPDADWDAPDQAFTGRLDAGEIKYVRLLIKYDQQTNSLGHGLLDYAVLFLPRAEREARLEMYGLKKVGD